MPHDEIRGTDRRTFLQAGALAAAAAGLPVVARAQEPAAPKVSDMPRRKLGNTGVEITMLDQGSVRGPSLDRVLRMSYAAGVRTFDTAKVYGSEPNFKKWFEQSPEVRKEIFLITKDEMHDAKQMMPSVEERLEALGTDHIDLFFMHGLGDGNVGGPDHAIELLKSKEFRAAADAVRKSGKAKFIGFSTHCARRADLIQAAADAGSVDAIMLQYSPWVEKDSAMDKALDSCHKKGIGLISMKQMAGKFGGPSAQGRRREGPTVLEEVVQKVPVLKDRKLSPFQGLLTAIWTDERITSVCTSMKNTDEIRENIDAAKRFEPLKTAELMQLRDAVLATGPTLCQDCDGRCAHAAGTTAELGNLTRFLTYHEHFGHRTLARNEYAALTDAARNWAGADLAAARAACPSGLDFAALLPEVERHLA